MGARVVIAAGISPIGGQDKGSLGDGDGAYRIGGDGVDANAGISIRHPIPRILRVKRRIVEIRSAPHARARIHLRHNHNPPRAANHFVPGGCRQFRHNIRHAIHQHRQRNVRIEVSRRGNTGHQRIAPIQRQLHRHVMRGDRIRQVNLEQAVYLRGIGRIHKRPCHAAGPHRSYDGESRRPRGRRQRIILLREYNGQRIADRQHAQLLPIQHVSGAVQLQVRPPEKMVGLEGQRVGKGGQRLRRVIPGQVAITRVRERVGLVEIHPGLLHRIEWVGDGDRVAGMEPGGGIIRPVIRGRRVTAIQRHENEFVVGVQQPIFKWGERTAGVSLVNLEGNGHPHAATIGIEGQFRQGNGRKIRKPRSDGDQWFAPARQRGGSGTGRGDG